MIFTARFLLHLLAGLALVGTTSAEAQVDARPVLGAPQRRAGERSGEPGGPAWSRAALQGESLAAVQALFGRVDADGDGRLDVRESDHGGVDWMRMRHSDFDRDGRLDLEEFTVARQRELARRGQPAAPNLLAESTRIQALWRARAARPERESRPSPADDDTAARLRRLLGSAPTPGPLPGTRAPVPGSGPAQARLTGALESSAAQTAERARRAQLLLELRRREREERP
ncbi:MAG TPA: EF-hand domain-containing protein [Planctomycetota bacterium]|nr:EF-hand domain-containing protein [Planctomycetota bacterium]